MDSATPHTVWHSQFQSRQDEDSGAPDRGRALGALVVAGAIVTAVVKVLMTPDEPIPVTFCLVCALVAWLGVTLSVICSQCLSRGSLRRALRSLPSLAAVAVLLAGAGGTIFHYFFNARLIYAEAAKSFTCIEDRIDFLLRQSDLRVVAIAAADLAATYTPEQLDEGYIAADLRAIEQDNYDGKGLFLATGRDTSQRKANVIVENATSTPIVLVCDGPTQAQLIIEPQSRASLQLDPGDYHTSVSLQGNYAVAPLRAAKRVVAGGLYRGIIRTNSAGYLARGALAHQTTN